MANIYNSQLDAFSIYHIEAESPSSLINHASTATSTALPALGHAISGSTGTAISNLATYPLDLIITRLQTQRLRHPSKDAHYTDPTSDHYDGVLDAAQKIYNRDGLAGFYAGIGPDTAKSVLDSFLFFLFYNYLRTNRQTKNKVKGLGGTLSAFDELSIGATAGGLSKLFTTPLSNITTRAQTTRGHHSMAEIAQHIQEEKGLMGFWSGYSASLVLTLNPALTFLFYETFKKLLPFGTRQDPGARLTFLMAAASKAMASSITYPFSLAKARAQASSVPTHQYRSAHEMKEAARSDINTARQSTTAARQVGRKDLHRAADATVLSTILRIANEDGIGALYAGLSGEVLKGFFSHGITMLVKEQVHGWVIRLYYYLSNMYSRANPSHKARTLQGDARDAYERAAEEAQRLGHQAQNMAGDASESVKGAATDAYERAANTANDLAAKARGQQLPGGVVEPSYGAIPVPGDRHTTSSTSTSQGYGQSGPGGAGQKAQSQYDRGVGVGGPGTNTSKSIAAGKTHSVYDQAVRATRNQDSISSTTGAAEPMGKRTFPKGSEANVKIDKEGVRREFSGQGGKQDGAEGVAYMRNNGATAAKKGVNNDNLTGHGDVGNIPKMDVLREKKGAGN